MRVEVNYSGRGNTRSVLKWIAVGMALHVALRVLVFCEDEADVELSFNTLRVLIPAGWTTDETRALVNIPLPIMKVELTHSRLSLMRGRSCCLTFF